MRVQLAEGFVLVIGSFFSDEALSETISSFHGIASELLGEERAVEAVPQPPARKHPSSLVNQVEEHSFSSGKSSVHSGMATKALDIQYRSSDVIEKGQSDTGRLRTHSILLMHVLIC